MKKAQELYKSIGFYDIDPYTYNEVKLKCCLIDGNSHKHGIYSSTIVIPKLPHQEHPRIQELRKCLVGYLKYQLSK